MKKNLTTLLFSFCAMIITAQNSTSITVEGITNHIDKNFVYKASVIVGNTYSNSDNTTIEEIKTKYKNALKKAGINLNNLTENYNAYVLYGYDQDGTVYHYTTSSYKEIIKFLSVKSFGMRQLSPSAYIQISKKEQNQIFNDALANAKAKAKIMASKMGKKLGKTLYIEDTNRYQQEIYVGYNYEGNPLIYTYSIKVKFELKE